MIKIRFKASYRDSDTGKKRSREFAALTNKQVLPLKEINRMISKDLEWVVRDDRFISVDGEIEVIEVSERHKLIEDEKIIVRLESKQTVLMSINSDEINKQLHENADFWRNRK